MPFKVKVLNLAEVLAKSRENWIGKPLLDEDALEIYINAFRKGGFIAPMRWYRNLSANRKDMKRFLVDNLLPFVSPACWR